ncbi:MAG: NAD-dependent epimerase/dehydratase family protein [Bacteroidota bacterium]
MPTLTLPKILVIGAAGQIGVELTLALRAKYGAENVIASDISAEPELLKSTGPWETIDVLSAMQLQRQVIRAGVTQIYLLAAMLSARGETDPRTAWDLNMDALMNVLEISRELHLQVFWPSSIAAASPSTIYGISKFSGEYLCQYYHAKFGLDVRSLRYPGLISYKTKPGGGTTDYAVDIFHAAIDKKVYECFLKADTLLPMMYMNDAVRATLMLMDTTEEKITNRRSYDISGMSFTPKELFEKIKAFCPSFEIVYEPDHRQKIAESWPETVDDVLARTDWNWKPSWNLCTMVNDMLVKLDEQQMQNRIQKLEMIGEL